METHSAYVRQGEASDNQRPMDGPEKFSMSPRHNPISSSCRSDNLDRLDRVNLRSFQLFKAAKTLAKIADPAPELRRAAPVFTTDIAEFLCRVTDAQVGSKCREFNYCFCMSSMLFLHGS